MINRFVQTYWPVMVAGTFTGAGFAYAFLGFKI